MIERTYSDSRVQSVLSNKELNRRAGKVPVEAYRPSIQHDIYYLMAVRDGKDIGTIVFHCIDNPILYQAHVNYLPEHWGEGLSQYSIEAIQWMFDNTRCQKIIALSPDCYPEVVKHALKCGFKEEGYLTDSIVINGERMGQTILGVGLWAQQQQ